MSRREMRNGKSQRGIALLAMLAVFVMGGTYFMLRALNSQPSVTAAERTRNAEVLNRAKQALIGYVAQQAAMPGENNPGRLPCPETAVGDGIAAGNCTLPAVGRLPWRTLGLDTLRDASGEPLWYVVSAGWALPTAVSLLTINSDTLGQLTLDGQANAAIALIVAPGAPMNVTAAGCTARIQARTAIPPDLRDYLECDNATFGPPDAIFTTSGPMASFNDQVLPVTTGDLLPALEAAIAHRIEREIAPVIRTMYGTAQWSLTAINPMFPYAAPFANPGTSPYVGAAGTFEGLLPFSSQAATTTWNGAPTLTVSQPLQIIGIPNCTIGAGNRQAHCSCTGGCSYLSTGTAMNVRMTATTQQSLANGMHALDSSKILFRSRPFAGAWAPPLGAAATGVLDPAGAAQILSEGTLALPIGVYEFEIETFSDEVIVPHSLLDSTNPTTGWFARNQWHQLSYYATSPNHTAQGLPAPSCLDATSPTPLPTECLHVTNVAPTATGKQRALLLLTGRSLNGTARPNATLADYVEYDNGDGVPRAFEQQPISRVIPASAVTKTPFNDRVVVLDANL